MRIAHLCREEVGHDIAQIHRQSRCCWGSIECTNDMVEAVVEEIGVLFGEGYRQASEPVVLQD